MTRNRSKAGKLASETPERIEKWLEKLSKLEKHKREMLRELNRPVEKSKEVNSCDTDYVLCRIEKIKDIIKKLKSEIRDLEKDLGISRKESKVFGGKGKRSKYQRLRDVK